MCLAGRLAETLKSLNGDQERLSWTRVVIPRMCFQGRTRVDVIDMGAAGVTVRDSPWAVYLTHVQVGSVRCRVLYVVPAHGLRADGASSCLPAEQFGLIRSHAGQVRVQARSNEGKVRQTRVGTV